MVFKWVGNRAEPSAKQSECLVCTFCSFWQAYERGISLFKWPNVYDIWNTYLTKFIDRYGGKKLERARDLFEQALDGCPQKFAKSMYEMSL